MVTREQSHVVTAVTDHKGDFYFTAGLVGINFMAAIFNLACMANGISSVALFSNDKRAVKHFEQQLNIAKCNRQMDYRLGLGPTLKVANCPVNLS